VRQRDRDKQKWKLDLLIPVYNPQENESKLSAYMLCWKRDDRPHKGERSWCKRSAPNSRRKELVQVVVAMCGRASASTRLAAGVLLRRGGNENLEEESGFINNVDAFFLNKGEPWGAISFCFLYST
jgi:hypothetical protein